MEGKEEGKLEGKLEGKTEVVQNLLHEGFKVESIAKFTGLSIDKVNKIIKDLYQPTIPQRAYYQYDNMLFF